MKSEATSPDDPGYAGSPPRDPSPTMEARLPVASTRGDATPIISTADGSTIDHLSAPSSSPTGDPPSLPGRRAIPGIPGYEVLAELGRGGMGVVYKARQARLNRTVALKMILAGDHASAEAGVRFLAEAEAIAKIQHPNIVQIFHIAEHDGHPYFEMEFVGGGSLADKLDGTPRQPRHASQLVETIARAMAEAHRLGVIHRDLKPGNILLATDGTPKVADFGLAKLMDVDSGLTATESVMGSPSYMAPEQAEGKAKELGPAADLYALGAILYELLTGRPPFRGATVLDTLQQVKTAEPIPPSRLVPGLPRDVETIALKCLQKDPAQRYESSSALAEDLRRYQAGEPIAARPVGKLERGWRWCRRNPVVAGSLGAAAAALAAVAVISTIFAVNQAEAIKESNLRLAALEYERGQTACEKGQIGVGLLRMLQSWRSAVAAGERGRAWQHTARSSLSAWQGRHPEIQTVFSHESSITTVAFSPDGKTVITGSEDNTARFWDASTGLSIGQILTHKGTVLAAAFSPDSKTVITGSEDGTVQIWDASTDLSRSQFSTHSGGVRAVAFSPDGKTVITGSWDGTARLWDATTGQSRVTPLAHQGPVWAVAFSPDGKTIITGGDDGMARLWDASTGQPLGQPLQQQDFISAIAFSPDGKTIITGGMDKSARLWDASTGRPIGRPLTHEGWVRAVAFSPDGKAVVTGSADNTARLWDATTGLPIGQPLTHQGTVRAVAFSPDGQTVVTGSHDRTARLWASHQARPSPIHTMKHDKLIMDVAFSPDGRTVITGGWDKTARLWDVSTGRPIGEPLTHRSRVWDLAFSLDGKSIITGSEDGTIRLWDASTGRPISQSPTQQGYVWDLSFSPDCKMVVTCSGGNNEARLWDASTGRPIGRPLTHRGWILSVEFSPDGKTVITGSEDKTAQLWDISTGLPLGQPLRHLDAVSAGAISSDGKIVITGSFDKTARLWDASTGRSLCQPLMHRGTVWTVAFSPDGKIVMTGSEDGRAQLWDTSTGLPLGQPLMHQDTVWTAAFSPDARIAITGSADNTARLWEVPSELPNDLDRVANWVESITGLTLDDSGNARGLDNAEWLRRREKVQLQGGSPVTKPKR